jgi:MoxR-like ATPase
MSTEPIDVSAIAAAFRSLHRAVGRVVVGQPQAVRLAFVTFLCSAHSLIEGVPGVAKTLLVKTLAGAVAVRFGRVQFTPDLMPSDIIGTSIFDPRDTTVRFRPGPLFTDLLLADEINRASAKTQSALLEAMQERAATVDGERHLLGEHFTVFATQNPVEQEGTYPLPEAELDRFLFKIVMDYPSEEDERALLALHHPGAPENESSEPVLQPREIAAVRATVARVIVRDDVVAYATQLVRATRKDLSFSLGASPRAGLMLLRAAKANAALEGRDYVLPEDVQEMWLPTLRHRIQLDPAAEVEGLNADDALERTLRGIAVPR